jgi:hypothetical protein
VLIGGKVVQQQRLEFKYPLAQDLPWMSVAIVIGIQCPLAQHLLWTSGGEDVAKLTLAYLGRQALVGARPWSVCPCMALRQA